MLRNKSVGDPYVDQIREDWFKYSPTHHPDLASLSLEELSELHRRDSELFELMHSSDPGYDAVWKRLSEYRSVYIRRWAKENNTPLEIESLLLCYPEEGPSIVTLNAQKALEKSKEFENSGSKHARRHVFAYRSLSQRLERMGIVKRSVATPIHPIPTR